MIESAQAYFVTPIEALSFRWLAQVVLLSLGLTLASRFCFTADALSRRSLGVAAVWILAVVPLLLLIWQPRYQIGVSHPPEFFLARSLTGMPLVVLCVWLAATSYLSFSMLVSLVRSRRDIGRLPAFPSQALGSIRPMAGGYARRLKIVEPLIVSGERCCASSIGEARVVVPESFTQWPASAQRSVIAHELVHLKRHDDRFMIALQLLARCYLFCPWLNLLHRRFVLALEEACDERAAELVGSRSLYLQGLAEAALREGSGTYDRSGPVAALINADHKHSFMRRLARLLEQQRFFEVQSGALLAGLGIGLLSLVALTTFEFVDVPERRQGNLMSVSSYLPATDTADLSYTTPEVTAVSRLPNEFAGLGERASPAVIYPGRALLDGIEGEVLVEFGITADGNTVHPNILRSSHPNYLNRAALRAVEQTVYYTRYNNKQSIGFSGVGAALNPVETGGLRAVGRKQSNRAEKLFLFRLNVSD